MKVTILKNNKDMQDNKMLIYKTKLKLNISSKKIIKNKK